MKTIIKLFVAVFFIIIIVSCGNIKASNPSSPQKQNKTFVSVQSASKTDLISFIDVSGLVQANKFSEVKSQTEGIIETINVKENQYIEKGRIIAVINPNERVAIISHNQLLVEQIEQKIKKYDNNSVTYKVLIIELETAKQNLEYAKKSYQTVSILAPMSGIVTNCYLNEGSQVGFKEKVLTISDMNSLVIKAELNEKYFQSVKTGRELKIILSAYPELVLTGVISLVYPEINQATRTVKFDVEIKNFEEKLLPGMTANLKFPAESRINVIAIPNEAILFDAENNKNFIYIVSSGKTAVKRIITKGISVSGKTEIVTGLIENEHIVIKGQEMLTDGITVTVVENS